MKNTQRRTVQGELEGDPERVSAMKIWLQKTGSPMSRIEKVVFKNERIVNEYSMQEYFEIRWDVWVLISSQKLKD